MPQKSTLHQAALRYAAAGVPVFPCRANGKEPATPHGFKDATTDPAQIDAWWHSDPNLNIAVEPERMGLAVIDADPGGDTSPYPRTFSTGTPRGGWHLWYRGSLPPSASRLAPHIDTRGRQSYVLVPPSIVDKPYTGQFPPEDWECADLPADIAARLTPVQAEKRTAPDGVELDKPLAIQEAKQFLAGQEQPVEGAGSDDQMYKAAARLKDLGISPEVAALLLHKWAPYFDEDWIEAKIEHVYDRYGQNEIGCDVPKSGAETFGAVEPVPEHSVSIVKGKGGRPQLIRWLWQDWLPRGKMTIFSGEKGVGKSTLVYHVLATITSGGKWPDGTVAPVGDVLIWSAEDDWEDTILPRLMVAHANFEHVYHVEGVKLPDGGKRTFDPAIDMKGLLDAAAAIPTLVAVLIDPVVSAVAGDSHKNAETRRGLQPLVNFAGERKAAVIGITHFSKNTQGRSPLDRINGSLAFGAIARMVWGGVQSEDAGAPRRLVRIATNIAAWGGGFDYTLHRVQVPGEEAGFMAQALVWGAFVEGSANAQIAEVQGGEQGASKLKEAENFLLTMLENDRWVEVGDIRKAAEAHVIAWETLKRAKRNLGVEAKQRPGATAAFWCWRLPPRELGAEIEY